MDENWAEGMLGDKIGIFPILYVEVNTHVCKHMCMRTHTHIHTHRLTDKRRKLQINFVAEETAALLQKQLRGFFIDSAATLQRKSTQRILFHNRNHLHLSSATRF